MPTEASVRNYRAPVVVVRADNSAADKAPRLTDETSGKTMVVVLVLSGEDTTKSTTAKQAEFTQACLKRAGVPSDGISSFTLNIFGA